ncbi:MAG: hypothetical protein KBT49_02595 [Bacteroidetes bacterium]|nr:hypothetical protein [Candidatus Colenecus caballi]
MKRFYLYIVAMFICGICGAQRNPTYFDDKSYWFNLCDYFVKGEILEMKRVVEDETFHVSAVRIKIIDSYGAVLPDTIWMYPDIENYYNGQGKVQTQNRDSLISITQKDINFDSGTHINSDDIFRCGAVNYFRFRREEGHYLYSLGDNYFQVTSDGGRVIVLMSNYHRFFNSFKAGSKKYSVPVTRFERRISKCNQ